MTLSNGINTANTDMLHETTDSDEASDDKKETVKVSKSEEKKVSPNNSDELERKRGSSDSFGLVSNETTSDDLANQDKNPTLENGLNTINSSEEKKAMAPDTSYINVDKDNAPISGRNRSSDALPGYPSYAPPMMNTLSNKTFSTDENSSPVIFESSNTSSVRKDTAGTLKRDENSGLLPNNYSMSRKWFFFIESYCSEEENIQETTIQNNLNTSDEQIASKKSFFILFSETTVAIRS
ncbi:hypothetical protein OIU78_002032 [Salix suchowensis]|nr:hypothetical protein OIU78_002032 [Salix suchowensis]